MKIWIRCTIISDSRSSRRLCEKRRRRIGLISKTWSLKQLQRTSPQIHKKILFKNHRQLKTMERHKLNNKFKLRDPKMLATKVRVWVKMIQISTVRHTETIDWKVVCCPVLETNLIMPSASKICRFTSWIGKMMIWKTSIDQTFNLVSKKISLHQL